MAKFKKQLYGINLPTFEKQIAAKYLNPAKLDCKTVSDGIILPLRKTELPATDGIYEGGVCDTDFNFIAGYKRIDNGRPNNFECIRSYKPSAEVEVCDEEVVFAGITFAHFGHFLVETFNRLWWVIQNQAFDKKIVFLKNKAFDSDFLKLLTYTGIPRENIIFLDKPTRFKKVYIPDQSLCYLNYYHQEYALPYQTITTQIPAAGHKKIYLSRTQFRKKDCIGEEYFEQFYRNQGYHIVYPEQLDITEQIALISGADEIVSTIGTISHLALFAHEGAKIVTLLRARNYFNIPQAIINQAKGLDYTFVDATCNFLPHRYSANCYYIGPTPMWQRFVKAEYGIDLNIDFFAYLNSDQSHMGDYFKQWLKIFSKPRDLKKIQNDTTLNILNTLELATANQDTPLQTTVEKLQNDLGGNQDLRKTLSGKIFKFSRQNNSHLRVIVLADSGRIETIQGNANDNESFWAIRDNELVFLNINKQLTSRYFYLKETPDGYEGLGYYEPNRSIIFKLVEAKLA